MIYSWYFFQVACFRFFFFFFCQRKPVKIICSDVLQTCGICSCFGNSDAYSLGVFFVRVFTCFRQGHNAILAPAWVVMCAKNNLSSCIPLASLIISLLHIWSERHSLQQKYSVLHNSCRKMRVSLWATWSWHEQSENEIKGGMIRLLYCFVQSWLVATNRFEIMCNLLLWLLWNTNLSENLHGMA